MPEAEQTRAPSVNETGVAPNSAAKATTLSGPLEFEMATWWADRGEVAGMHSAQASTTDDSDTNEALGRRLAAGPAGCAMFFRWPTKPGKITDSGNCRPGSLSRPAVGE